MSKRNFWFGSVISLILFLSLLPALPSAAQDCVGADEIAEPTEFVWTDAGDHFVGVLEYGEATFTIGGETLTTRAYRQAGGEFSIPWTNHEDGAGTHVCACSSAICWTTSYPAANTTSSKIPTSPTCTPTASTSRVRVPATT